MDLTPEEYQEYKRHAFDSYIKTTLKHEAWKEYREIRRKCSREISLASLQENAMESLSVTDRYSWEYYSFSVGGTLIIVENETLGLALEKLNPKDRDIILMYWFLDMADKEIACHMHIARRTVNDRRRKSYKKIKEWMLNSSHEKKA